MPSSTSWLWPWPKAASQGTVASWSPSPEPPAAPLSVVQQVALRATLQGVASLARSRCGGGGCRIYLSLHDARDYLIGADAGVQLHAATLELARLESLSL